MEYKKVIIYITVISISFFIGRFTKPETNLYQNNIELVMESIETTDRCMNGWRNTLDLLNEANELLNNSEY